MLTVRPWHDHPDDGVAEAALELASSWLEGLATFEEVRPLASLVEQDDVCDRLAKSFSSAKVMHPFKPFKSGRNPLYGELDFERRRLRGETFAAGIMYEARTLAEGLLSVLPAFSSDVVDVVVTNRLFGTWSDVDRRFHARIFFYAGIGVVSSTGLVEAPALPQEFYRAKAVIEGMGTGITPEILRTEYYDEAILHSHPKMADALAGMIVQSLSIPLGWEYPCDNPECKVFDAHRHRDLVQAQLFSEKCEKHPLKF